ncbi:hypothetical protein BGZ99_001414 [Dissophora globulifera]|uniref:Uncharacterized protein n=1 Tax=Dissophora globulifera TaxID=979702 RepID=A0A9P6R0Y5_9FUNG|nr:hypothetical protein BGZ99_001414 [Dissophora globulifera]
MGPKPYPCPDWLQIIVRRPEERQEGGEILLNVSIKCENERVYSKVAIEGKSASERRKHPLCRLAIEMFENDRLSIDVLAKGHFWLNPYKTDKGAALTSKLIVQEVQKVEETVDIDPEDQDIFDTLPFKVYENKAKDQAPTRVVQAFASTAIGKKRGREEDGAQDEPEPEIPVPARPVPKRPVPAEHAQMTHDENSSSSDEEKLEHKNGKAGFGQGQAAKRSPRATRATMTRANSITVNTDRKKKVKSDKEKSK